MPTWKRSVHGRRLFAGPAWRNRTLLSVSFVVAAAYIGVGMVGPVRVLFAQSHGASLEIIGLMASAYLISNFLFQYPSGWLADHWGRRRVLIVSLAISAVLSLVYLFIEDPLLFIALRFVEGAAAAGMLPAARALIIDSTPIEEQGEAFGIFNSFFNSGFLLGPAIGSLLAVQGYTGAFIGAVVFRVVALVIVGLVVHEVRKEPERNEPIIRRGAALKALFSLPLVGAYMLALGDYLYLGFDQTLMPIWIKNNLGGSVAIIGLTYVLWAIPSMVFSPWAGRIADRYRRSTLILIFGMAQVPIYLAYTLANAAWQIPILFGIHGLIYAFAVTAVDAHLAKTVDSRVRAQAQSMYTTIGLIGAFIGASGLTTLYSISFRLPLLVMTIAFGVLALLGGLIIRYSEIRKMIVGPESTE